MPGGIKVADTYASFKIEGSRAERAKLERELRSLANTRVKVRLDPDWVEFRANLARPRASNRVRVVLDPDWTRFRASLAARTYEVRVRTVPVGNPAAAGDGSNGVGNGRSGAASAAGSAAGSVAAARLGSSLFIAGNQSAAAALKITAAGLAAFGLVGPLGAATVGVITLSGAMKGMLGVVAYLPAALDTVTASAAALLIGVKGIPAALQAAGAVTREAGKDTRDYAREATLAGRSVRNAYEGQLRAQKAYGDATREAERTLQDYALALSEIDTAARRASQSVTSAQHALDAARADPTAGPDAIADAELDLEEARQRSTRTAVEGQRTVDDAARASASGYEGVNATIMDAQWGLRDAAEAVSDALYEQSVPLAENTAAVSEYNRLMGLLSPAARDVVEAILEQRDAWREVQNAVSQALLEGVGDQIRQTVATWKAPFTEGMVDIADSMNLILDGVFEFLNDPANVDRAGRVFENIALFLERLAPAFDPFLTALQIVSEEGTSRLPAMADSLTDLAERFERFVTIADGDGSLAAYFDGVGEAFELFGDTLGWVWPPLRELLKGLGVFAKAAGPSAERVFGALAENLARVDWTLIGTAFGDLIVALIPLMPAFTTLANTLLPAILTTLTDVATYAMPYILEGLQWISDHPDLAAGLLLAFIGLQGALAVITPLIGPVLGLITSITGVLPSGGGSLLGLANAPAPVGGFLGFLASPGTAVAIGAIVGAVALVAVAVATHIPEIKRWIEENETTIDEWGRKFEEIWGRIETAFELGIQFVDDLWDLFWPSLSDSLPAIGDGILTALDGIFTAIGGVFKTFSGLLTGDWEMMWEGLADVVVGIGNTVLGSLQSILNGFLSAIHSGARWLEKVTGGAVKAGDLPVIETGRLTIDEYDGANTRVNYSGGGITYRSVEKLDGTADPDRSGGGGTFSAKGSDGTDYAVTYSRNNATAFAKGGEVYGEQVAIVGDNASGRERITPLDRDGVSATEREMIDMMRMLVAMNARPSAPAIVMGDVSFRSRDDIDYFRTTVADEMARIADNSGRMVTAGGGYDA